MRVIYKYPKLSHIQLSYWWKSALNAIFAPHWCINSQIQFASDGNRRANASTEALFTLAGCKADAFIWSSSALCAFLLRIKRREFIPNYKIKRSRVLPYRHVYCVFFSRVCLRGASQVEDARRLRRCVQISGAETRQSNNAPAEPERWKINVWIIHVRGENTVAGAAAACRRRDAIILIRATLLLSTQLRQLLIPGAR